MASNANIPDSVTAVGGDAADDSVTAIDGGGGSLGRTVLGYGLEVGLPIVGGVGGAFIGGPGGAIVGASGGGALGTYIRQLMEIGSGEREEVSAGEVVTSGAVSAIPASFLAKQVARSAGLLKPGMIRAGQGFVTGASSEVAEKAIDEGRLPTWEEFGARAGASAALGGALGVVEKRYAMAGRLIANPVAAKGAQVATGLGAAAYAYNDAVEKGDENPMAVAFGYGAAAYGATHLPSMLMKIEQDRARRLLLGPEAVAGKEVVKIQEDLRNNLAAYRNHATESGNRLASAVEAEGKALDLPNLKADVFSAIDGKASASLLPKNVRLNVEDFQAERIANTERIIELYPHLSTEQVKAIRGGQNSYLRTAYAAHDPRAVKEVDYATEASAKKLRSELATGFRNDGMSEPEALNAADVAMSKMVNDVGFMFNASLEGGPSGSSAASAFMRKGNPTQAVRDYLGEITDPGARVRATLNTQSRLILQEEQDKALYAALSKSGIISAVKRNEQDVLVHSAEDPILHRRMTNMYAPREFVEAYREINSPHILGDNAVARAYMSLSGFSKAMKTVGNVLEMMVPQSLTNLMLGASSWKLNPADIGRSARAAAAAHGVGTKGWTEAAKISWGKELREMQGFGVIGGSSDMNELTAFVSDSAASTKMKDVVGKWSKVYGFPDSAVRFSIYKQNLDEVLSFGPAYYKSLDNAKKLAANVTNDQFPTYERIPRRLRQLSAVGAANVFGSFEFEVMRNVKNQVVYAAQLINSNNPAMRKAGFKRMIGLSAVAGGTAAVATYGSQMMGASERDREAINNVGVPSYDADKANLITIGKDGKFSYIPLNYVMPYANLTATIGAALTGENPLPYLKSTLLGNDLGPLLTAGVETLTNTYYGTKVSITEPRDNTKLLERAVSRALVPQIVAGTMARIDRAARGETSSLGSSPTYADAAMRVAGVRQSTMDILGGASTRIRSIADPMAGELSGYHRILNRAVSKGDTSLSSIDEAGLYKERAARYERRQQELHKIFLDLQHLAKRTGAFGDNEIIATFRKSGVPNAAIAGAALGYTTPMSRGLSESNSDIVEKLVASGGSPTEVLRDIKTYAAGDAMKARRLVQTYTDMRLAERAGVDAVTKLFSGMGVSDGTRALNIYKAMQARPEMAEALNRRLRKTRTITPEVAQQIKKLAEGN